MEIRVGIHTAGEPRIRILPDGDNMVENMLIGKDFHWQQVISARLSGRVEICGSQLVNILPLERYLESVVGSEMNPDAPKEFLKAHAIISRSWAVGKILGCHPAGEEGKVSTSGELIGWDDTSQHTGYHVCSDDHCQRYQGRQPVASEALEAIRGTADTVILDSQGNVVDARFSKCCGGRTELFSTCWQNRDITGLSSFEDPWCDLRGLSSLERERVLRGVLKDYDLSTGGGYRWRSSITKDEVRKNLREKFGRDIGAILALHPVSRGASGRLSIMRIEGERGDLLLGKELWIRRLLSPTHLYSSAIEISEEGEKFEIEGKGWGHGVGLCQIGAARMALEGATCEEILSFYYPGTHLGGI